MGSVYPTSWAVKGGPSFPDLPCVAPTILHGAAVPTKGCFSLRAPRLGPAKKPPLLSRDPIIPGRHSAASLGYESSWPPGEKALPLGETGLFHLASGTRTTHIPEPSHLTQER